MLATAIIGALLAILAAKVMGWLLDMQERPQRKDPPRPDHDLGRD